MMTCGMCWTKQNLCLMPKIIWTASINVMSNPSLNHPSKATMLCYVMTRQKTMVECIPLHKSQHTLQPIIKQLTINHDLCVFAPMWMEGVSLYAGHVLSSTRVRILPSSCKVGSIATYNFANFGTFGHWFAQMKFAAISLKVPIYHMMTHGTFWTKTKLI